VGKKTIEIRVRATVEEGSVEEKLLAFLDDEAAIPFKKSEMWIKAAKMCWLSLALKYKQCPPDEIEESLYDCDYSWELHWEFLLNKARMRLARIRHRAGEVYVSAKEFDSQIHQRKGNAGETDSERLPLNNQSNNGITSQSCLDTKIVQSDELEDGDNVLPDNEPIPQSFNLFGNSIISKQG
jgi:hypothetical protein